MIRSLLVTVSVLLAGAAPALAQTHPGPHAGTHPHGPGHIPPDPATHAALHALLHGSWTGTFWSPQGESGGLDLSITPDSLRAVTLKLSAAQPLRAGIASDFVMTADTLHWAQDLSGASCKATAVVSPATATAPEVMKGKMACDNGELGFTLHKKTG